MEIVEQDTVESEDIQNLLEYILPSGGIPANANSFGMQYNRRLFNGWVKQPSPCCAAASVAGAWNSLSNLHRSDHNAVQHNNVLDLYREMFKSLIESKQASFERKLSSPIGSFLEVLKYQLSLLGKEIGGKKGFGASKKVVLVIIKQLVKEFCENNKELLENTTPDANDMRQKTAIENFKDLLAEEGFVVQNEGDAIATELASVKSESSAAPAKESNGDSDYEQETDSEDEAANAGGDVVTVAVKGASKKSASLKKAAKDGQWDWKKDLMDLIRNMAGLAKLNRAKSSTAAIGNWGVMDVTSRLSEAKNTGSYVSCRLFMGQKKTAKSKVDVAVSAKDDEAAITAQWDALKYVCLYMCVCLQLVSNHSLWLLGPPLRTTMRSCCST